MPTITIDGIAIDFEPGMSILQAAELAGIEIPRFCYHDRLAVAGNCRMCLVQVEKAPKPVASCAMPAGDGMVVHTRSDYAKKARHGVMEFLLINHPLDCPICDQGGECDLQDQAMAYGEDRSRYTETKRAVPSKAMGPLIRTYMTRCIHCTRCIRFAQDVAGVPELGATGRGEAMEVTTYVGKALSSEMSANIIDLCPVGALTSGPYAYVSRPWELRKTESIDVLDAVGSAIRVDARGNEVLRILPRLNEDVNEEWISDKTRFACDALVKARLDTPYVRKNGALTPVSWQEAFTNIAARLEDLEGSRIGAIAGNLVDVESVVALKALMTALGSPHTDCRQDGAKLDASVRASYIFNPTIAGIEEADAVLIVGSDPRKEAPVLSARIRKRYLQRGTKGLPVAVIGPEGLDLTYPTRDLGNDLAVLNAIAAGAHPFAEVLRDAEKPMLILGMGALARADGGRVLGQARAVAEALGLVKDGWNGFGVLHTAAGRVGALDAGFVPGTGGLDLAGMLGAAQDGGIEVVYLLGADDVPMDQLGEAFVIYQGHHGDAGAARADVILPGAAYTEKDATYVNTEGRVQRARMAVFPPGEAREDWKILRALGEVLGHKLPFDTLEQVRARMEALNPVFAMVDEVQPAAWGPFGQPGVVEAGPVDLPVSVFYQTDPISRASATMARCVADILGQDETVRTGTDG